MTALLAACGGFLLAVLWMDLIFDVQVLPHRGAPAPLPEPVLASIAAYYRRATSDSRPMGRLVGAVMAIAVGCAGLGLVGGGGALAPRLLSFALLVPPVGLALARIVPNAVRLGARRDDAAGQSALARAICRDHLFCLASIAAFVALQLARAFAR